MKLVGGSPVGDARKVEVCSRLCKAGQLARLLKMRALSKDRREVGRMDGVNSHVRNLNIRCLSGRHS